MLIFDYNEYIALLTAIDYGRETHQHPNKNYWTRLIRKIDLNKGLYNKDEVLSMHNISNFFVSQSGFAKEVHITLTKKLNNYLKSFD